MGAAIPCSGGGRQGLREGSWWCDCGDVRASRRGMVRDHSVSFFGGKSLLRLPNGMECERWSKAFKFTSILW